MAWLKDTLGKFFNAIFNTFRSAAGMQEKQPVTQGKRQKDIEETRQLRADTYIAMLDELKNVLKIMPGKSETFKQTRDLSIFIAERLVDRRGRTLRNTDPEVESAIFYQTKTGLNDRYRTLRQLLIKTDITDMKEPMKRLKELVAQIKLAARLIRIESTQRTKHEAA